jgi:hypothetical protein
MKKKRHIKINGIGIYFDSVEDLHNKISGFDKGTQERVFKEIENESIKREELEKSKKN